jgi:hypothetical protein
MYVCLSQACGVAEELLKTEFDAAHLIFNRFKSAIAYKPTLATVLSPDVSGWLYDNLPVLRPGLACMQHAPLPLQTA